MKNKKVLIISHDKVGANMAGPGMRYHQMALELSKYFHVTLAVFNPSYIEDLQGVPYDFKDIKAYDFQKEFDNYNTIIALWLSPDMINYAKQRKIQLVFDLYAPVPVENLVALSFAKHKPSVEEDYNYLSSLEGYRTIMKSGDFFLCSNETQRIFWTGYGFASSAVIPSQYEDFPLYDRVSICPMGTNVDDLKKLTNKHAIQDLFPTIKRTDFVIVWTGGIWDWFDSLTPIKALKKLKDQGITDVKLVFLATRHPNKDIAEMGENERAYHLAETLGLKGSSVFFKTGWIPYDERLNYFASGDIALYAHKSDLEARFSHRTRVADHILVELPTIGTRGDYFSDLIEKEKLGISVPPQDPEAMAAAIIKLRDPETLKQIRKNLHHIRHTFEWSEALKPLVTFLQANHGSRPIITDVPQINNVDFLRSFKRYVPRPLKRHLKTLLMKKLRKN